MIKLFFCDVETTGTDATKHGIHQLSAIIEYVNDDGSREVKNKINIKMKPASQLEINDEALNVSGITKDILETYTDEKVAFKQLQHLLKQYVNPFNKQDKFFFVGYNVSFDNQFVRELFIRNNDNYFGSMFWSNPIDLMTMAGLHLINERFDMPNFQLMSTAQRLGIEIKEESAHDAMYDIEITRDMFWLLRGGARQQETTDKKSQLLNKTNLSEVNPLSGQKTLTKVDSEDFTFTFGKHAGMTIAEIFRDNPSYIIWVHDNCVKGIQFSHQIMDKAVKANEIKQHQFNMNKQREFQEGNSYHTQFYRDKHQFD